MTALNVDEVDLRVWPVLGDSAMLGADHRHEPDRLWTPTVGRRAEELRRLGERHDLRGRGGAGFPLAAKLAAVAEAADRAGVAPYVVVNGEEGEPASVKDRVLMSLAPDLVLDGAWLAADAVGARQVILYVSDAQSRTILEQRLATRIDRDRVTVFDAESGYVSGEESAVVRAVSGGPAKPTAKPPRVFESGVCGVPTLVSNVETLAQLARLARHSDDDVRQSVLLTVSSDEGTHRLIEAPIGLTLREVLTGVGMMPHRQETPVLLGGFFGRFVRGDAFDVPLEHQRLRDHGLSLGCGIVLILDRTCPVTAVAEILYYLSDENAQQCGPCFKGIPSMLAAVESIIGQDADDDQIARLHRWATTLPGRGNCGTLDAACGLVATLFNAYADLIDEHRVQPCRTCVTDDHRTPRTRFAAGWPSRVLEESA